MRRMIDEAVHRAIAFALRCVGGWGVKGGPLSDDSWEEVDSGLHVGQQHWTLLLYFAM